MLWSTVALSLKIWSRYTVPDAPVASVAWVSGPNQLQMTLLQVLFGVNQRLRVEDVDSPLVQIRPVETVLLAVISGDRGLCGGYNNQVIKKVILFNPRSIFAVQRQCTMHRSSLQLCCISQLWMRSGGIQTAEVGCINGLLRH